MRSSSHQVLVALLAATLLAGCAEEVPVETSSTPSVLLVTSANDEESLTNESFQMQAHVHDYWGGADRLVVMDETRSGSTFFVSNDFALRFVPEPGKFVPQGTASIEITLSWVDGARAMYASPSLWVRSAADASAVLVGPIENGGRTVMPATLASADLPHQALSRWVFEWHIGPGDAPPNLIWWEGDVTIRVEAVRGLEIPVYPPHPDLWGGFEELPLLDEGQGFGMWSGSVDAYDCFGSCPRVHRPGDGNVVPYDAAFVEVVLTQGTPSLTGVGLKFHAADSFDWIDLQPESVDGSSRTYRIPVTPAMGDSPYATQSQWEFAPYVSDPERDSFHAASYHLTARVLRTG